MNHRFRLRFALPATFIALALAAQGCASAHEDPAPERDEAPAADGLLDNADAVAPQCVVYNCYTCPDNGEENCGRSTSALGPCNNHCVAACIRTDTYCL